MPSAITSAWPPSGVKYRCKDLRAGTGLPGVPVMGLIGTTSLPGSSLTQSVSTSQALTLDWPKAALRELIPDGASDYHKLLAD